MVKGLIGLLLGLVLAPMIAQACGMRPLVVPFGCDPDGPWRPKNATVKYLYANDPVIADRMNAINLDGSKNCGWKP